MSVNKVILVGNLGRDPELRYLPSGQSVASFSVATSERFKGRDGQMRDQTEWHNVVVYGKPAEACGQYLKKGRQVYVEGRITNRSWDAKDGSGKKYRTEIVAQRVQFLGGRAGAGGAPEEPAEFAGAGGGADIDQGAPMDDEDIPF